ncbi:hypothetical protein N9043_00240 [bacterium]|nr:hypothetical protein [bacterium]
MNKVKLKKIVKDLCIESGFSDGLTKSLITDYLALEDFRRVVPYKNINTLFDQLVGEHIRVTLDKDFILIHTMNLPCYNDDSSFAEKLYCIEPEICSSLMLDMSEYGLDRVTVDKWLDKEYDYHNY